MKISLKERFALWRAHSVVDKLAIKDAKHEELLKKKEEECFGAIQKYKETIDDYKKKLKIVVERSRQLEINRLVSQPSGW